MSHDLVQDERTRSSLKTVGFGLTLDRFDTFLRSRGHAELTVQVYEQAAIHFALWLARKRARVRIRDATPEHVKEFLTRHLSNCRCDLGTRTRHTIRAALKQLFAALGISQSPKGNRSSVVEREIEKFDAHIRDTCGLQENTRIYRRRYVRNFLLDVSDSRPSRVSRLTPSQVIRYVSQKSSRLKPGSAQVLCCSLRSYLRYRQFVGDRVDGLLASVPTVPRWSLGSVPDVLTEEQLRCLLGSFDHETPIGLRDHAMTRCLADLGLRAGEVAGLRLDDVYWRTNTLRIVGGKSRRDDTLPLPATLGRAISVYLRRGRPQTAERSIFIRHRAPVGLSVTPMIVRNAVLRAARRTGLGEIVTGTRILRQTAATLMVCRGASLKDVADVLRHRCFDTTAIYTKVDLPRLAIVAMPWPEESR